MSLYLYDGGLLTESGALAASEDCCCGKCCEFIPCESEAEPVYYRCDTIPEGIQIGDVIKIGDECYEYNGVVECVGDESEGSFGDVYEDCQDCQGYCDICYPERMPDVIHLSVTSLLNNTCGGDCTPLLEVDLYAKEDSNCVWWSECIEIEDSNHRNLNPGQPCEVSCWLRWRVTLSGTNATLSLHQTCSSPFPPNDPTERAAYCDTYLDGASIRTKTETIPVDFCDEREIIFDGTATGGANACILQNASIVTVTF